MGLEEILEGFGNVIVPMLSDICTIENIVLKNIDGILQRDPVASTSVSGIEVMYEPLSRSPKVEQMILAGAMSADVTHKLLMRVTASTMAIKPNTIITVIARSPRPAMIFERPVRMDESMSPLLIVAAVLKNQ